jgi:hypothetical protein
MYISGTTSRDVNFPFMSPSGAYNQTYLPYGFRPYIAKFDNRQRVWCSLFSGGLGGALGNSFDVVVDNAHNAYLIGYTPCTTATTQSYYCTVPPSLNEQPICEGTNVFFQDDVNGDPHYGGNQYDGFIAGFNYDNQLIWATYFGGNNREYVKSLAFDDTYKRIFITGQTQSSSSSDYPIIDPGTTGTWIQSTNAGSNDVIIGRFNVASLDSDVPEFSNNRNNDLLNIYPNPTNRIINIDIKATDEPVIIKIFDITGKPVCQYLDNKNNSLHYEISIEEFPEGIYLVKTDIGNKAYSSKIVIYK